MTASLTQYNNETANLVQIESETNRRGERDVVSGARDTTSGRAGAVTDRQLLEVQPGQGGQVASDGESGQYGHSIEDVPDLVKVVKVLLMAKWSMCFKVTVMLQSLVST